MKAFTRALWILLLIFDLMALLFWPQLLLLLWRIVAAMQER